jgi:transposase InsO family protein
MLARAGDPRLPPVHRSPAGRYIVGREAAKAHITRGSPTLCSHSPTGPGFGRWRRQTRCRSDLRQGTDLLARRSGGAFHERREELLKTRLFDQRDRLPRQTRSDRLRPRNRVHLQRYARLGSRRPARLAFHRAGKPTQNGICEAFNGRTRDERLNETIFYDLYPARSTLARWTAVYNQKRPH